MEKDKWINEIINSTGGLHKAEPSPFLFVQVTAKIKKNTQPVFSSEGNAAIRWSLAVLVSVIISVNLISIVKSNVKDQNTAENTFTGTGFNLNNATIYSY